MLSPLSTKRWLISAAEQLRHLNQEGRGIVGVSIGENALETGGRRMPVHLLVGDSLLVRFNLHLTAVTGLKTKSRGYDNAVCPEKPTLGRPYP